MSEQEWHNPDQLRPPDGVIVDTLNSAGQMTQLVLRGNMWWFADMSMYIYYVPKFWRIPPAVDSNQHMHGRHADREGMQ